MVQCLILLTWLKMEIFAGTINSAFSSYVHWRLLFKRYIERIVLINENRKHEWNNLFLSRDEKRHFDLLFWCNTKLTLVKRPNQRLTFLETWKQLKCGRKALRRSRNNTRTIFYWYINFMGYLLSFKFPD